MKAYRICERKNGHLMTLFHPVNGSRKIPMNEWINATIRPVRDGSRKTAKEYISGFHAFENKEECKRFIKKFRAPRELVLVECEIEGIRKKDHSPSNILLVDRIKLNRVIEILKNA